MQQSAVSSALSAWVASGFPVGRCENLIDRVRTLVVDDTRPLCLRDAHGCRITRDVGLFGSGGSYTILVQRRDHAGRELIAHEMVHMLCICSGVDTLGDPSHWRPGVWTGSGAEGRVAEALKGSL